MMDRTANSVSPWLLVTVLAGSGLAAPQLRAQELEADRAPGGETPESSLLGVLVGMRGSSTA